MRLRTVFVAAMLFIVTSCLGWSSQLPSQAMLDLKSSEFRIRETAQQDLLAWGRRNPEQAMTELLGQAQLANDPEVRERCMTILRSLVTDEYMKEGEGYIGIALALKDEIVTVPGDQRPRNAIRVVEVREDTPGHQAGIRMNDLIVGLGKDVWHEVEASPLFREKIKSMKPNSNAELTILRAGVLIELDVKLGRRPLMADSFLNGRNFDPDASERAAKEAYFRRWLSQRKATK